MILSSIQIESERFILNLQTIDHLPFIKIQYGEDKIEKNVLISTDSQVSWIYANANNIDKVIFIH
jgi:hypothetical protein